MSSVIKSIEFNAAFNSIDVVFHYCPTIVYSYIGITKAEAVAFGSADSLGEYFHENIYKQFDYIKTSLCCSARVENGTKCPVCN